MGCASNGGGGEVVRAAGRYTPSVVKAARRTSAQLPTCSLRDEEHEGAVVQSRRSAADKSNAPSAAGRS